MANDPSWRVVLASFRCRGADIARQDHGQESNYIPATNQKYAPSLVLLAIGGIIYFVVCVVALHFLRPEYNPINHAVSNYAVGPFGFLMTSAFYMLALSVFALALVLFHSVALTSLSRVAILLLWVASCGIVVMGIFPGDAHALHPPATVTGVIHWTAAGASFLSIMIAAFLLPVSFKVDERFQRFQCPGFLFAMVMVGALVVYGLLALVGWIGIGQRIYLAVCLLWLLVLAAWLSAGVRKGKGHRQERLR